MKDLLSLNLRKKKQLIRFGKRIGYLGTGLLISGQWTLEPILYILGFVCVGVQVSIRRQWNLVALNVNGLAAWLMHLFK